MKTKVLFAVRCNPTKTVKLLEALPGRGTAFVTELISNKRGEHFICGNNFEFARKWEKLPNFEALKKAAAAGKDVIYKTASLSGAAKFYARRDS